MTAEGEFDMLDLEARFSESAAEQRAKEDIKKLKDILIKSVKTLSVYYHDIPSVHVCKSIGQARSVDGVYDVMENYYTYGVLEGVRVYTGTGVKMSDFYSHIDKKKNRLWKYMLNLMQSGSFNGSVCSILFRPRSSKNIWLLTTGAVPEHPLAPRIVVPSMATVYPNITIVRLDAIVQDDLDK